MKAKGTDLRINRNHRLMTTDYTQLPDCGLSDSKKEEWKVYRQKLRDLPNHSSAKFEDGKWVEVDWPDEPE
tara:strand:- start:37 stop:249 length:213 start_codon:yes stop_codon:yes gene_type:complete